MSEDTESFNYEPPVVTWEPITRRVERENDEGQVVVENETTGHRVKPPYDDSWDEITKLRWFAALIGHRTGVQVRVRQVDGEDALAYQVSTRTMEYTESQAPYEVTWGWLSGLQAGIHEGRISG